MAQTVDLWGATYSNVPYIKVPSGSGTAQFDDTTIASNAASASDITSGKLAFVNGELVTGTASGGGVTVEALSVTQNGTYTAPTGKAYSPVTVNVSGGGGLEYETGTWTPASDVAKATISFSKTHTTAPFFYMIADASNTYSDTTYSNYGTIYNNFGQLFNTAFYASSTVPRYALVSTSYRTSSLTSIVNGAINVTVPYTDQGDISSSYSRYWATETGIKASTESDSRYWRAGRTYKWIAVWKPTS